MQEQVTNVRIKIVFPYLKTIWLFLEVSKNSFGISSSQIINIRLCINIYQSFYILFITISNNIYWIFILLNSL